MRLIGGLVRLIRGSVWPPVLRGSWLVHETRWLPPVLGGPPDTLLTRGSVRWGFSVQLISWGSMIGGGVR